MHPRRLAVLVAAAGTVALALALAVVILLAPAGPPNASAAPCPDVEVVFARGTNEPAGVGGTGQAFVDALRWQAGDRIVNVYAVNYPASTDFPRASEGVIDAATHVATTATN